MRITNSTIARNYTRGLNNSVSRLNQLMLRAQTADRFTTMAENTAGGVRALEVRRNLARTETYIDNAKTMQSKLDAAEKQLYAGVMGIAQSVRADFTAAMSAEKQPDREIYANNLKKLQEQILSCANGSFNEQYLFGSANMSSPAFDYDATTNKLTYNGHDVATTLNSASSSFLQGDYDDATKSVYIDIGLGLQLDASGAVVPGTAYEASLNGLDIFGKGEENIVLVLGEMIRMLENPATFDPDAAGVLLDRFNDATDKVGVAITKMGADTGHLDFTVQRLDDEILNLRTRQQAIEKVDPATAIMDYEMQVYVYNASLQMGQNILQPTIFNFIK